MGHLCAAGHLGWAPLDGVKLSVEGRWSRGRSSCSEPEQLADIQQMLSQDRAISRTAERQITSL